MIKNLKETWFIVSRSILIIIIAGIIISSIVWLPYGIILYEKFHKWYWILISSISAIIFLTVYIAGSLIQIDNIHDNYYW